MTVDAKRKILLVEDEQDIRNLMLLHLSREGYEALGTEDGEEALRVLRLADAGGFEHDVLSGNLLFQTATDRLLDGLRRDGVAPVLRAAIRQDFLLVELAEQRNDRRTGDRHRACRR